MSKKQYLMLWLAVGVVFGMIFLPIAFRLFWLAKLLLVPAVAVLLLTVNWAVTQVLKPKQ